MSDAKALPDNLKELEENAEFKRVYMAWVHPSGASFMPNLVRAFARWRTVERLC